MTRPVTIEDWHRVVDGFELTLVAKGNADSTVRAFRAVAMAFVNFVFSYRKRGEVDASVETVAAYIKELVGRGLSANSIQARYWAIVSFCKFLKSREIIDFNPAAEFDVARVLLPSNKEATRELPYTKEEYEAMLAHLPSVAPPGELLGFRAFLVMLWETGMRRSDAANLQWEQIDWNRGTVSYRPGKTKDASAVCPITTRLRAMLKELKADAGPNSCGSVMPWYIAGREDQWKVCTKLPNWRGCHSFRRAFITRLVTANISPYVIATYTGQSLQTILTYTLPDDAFRLEILEKANQ